MKTRINDSDDLVQAIIAANHPMILRKGSQYLVRIPTETGTERVSLTGNRFYNFVLDNLGEHTSEDVVTDVIQAIASESSKNTFKLEMGVAA